MTQSVHIQLELPKDWRQFRMPPALQNRLRDLLDKQDQEGKLSTRERREAAALTELVDMLALMKIRAELAAKSRALSAGAELDPDPDGIYYRMRAFPGLWIHGEALFAKNVQLLMQILEEGMGSTEYAGFAKKLASQHSRKKKRPSPKP